MTGEIIGKCELCLKEKELQGSHILPSFTNKWLKDNSLTKYLRSAGNPNLRKQDLIKAPLLCTDCEGRLSEWEEHAASKLFKPWNDDRALDLDYDDWLLRFTTSLSWRTGIYCRDEFAHVKPDLESKYSKALENWRRFLLGEKNSCAPYEHHVFLWGPVEKVVGMDLPPKWHAYTLRGFDMSYVVFRNEVLIYSHIPGISFFSTVNPPRLTGSRGTWIAKRGTLTPGQDCPPIIGSWVEERSNEISDVELSEKQQKKITDEVLKAIKEEPNDEVLEKKGEALLLDRKWKGKSVE
jgi:hypothetical protein